MTQTSAAALRPRILLALVALALAAAVVVGIVWLSDRSQPFEVEPSPTPTPTSTDGGDARPDPVGTAASGDLPDPAERALGDLLVPAAGPFVSADLGEVEAPPDQGVVAAYSGTFTNGRDIVTLRALELASPEGALAAAESLPDGFTADDVRAAGDVGDPVVGGYTAFERDARGAIRWTNGRHLLELTGPWQQVRELYLAYPL